MTLAECPHDPRSTPSLELWTLNPRQAITAQVASINAVKPAATFRLGTFFPGSINADIGGGKYDSGTELLRKQQVTNVIFDPFNRSTEHNRKAIELIRGAQCKTCTVNNVLNILREAEVRDLVIREAADAITDDGVAYFQIYEGDRSGIGRVTQMVRGEPTSWQENRKTATYLPEIARYFQAISRSRNLIIATEPVKAPAGLGIKLVDYSQLLNSLEFGKWLPDAVYVYRDQAISLGHRLDGLTGRAADICGATWDHNVMKLRKKQLKVSFLAYPEFMADPHPALRQAITFDIEANRWTVTEYRTNRPILHRKELFLPQNHPRWEEFRQLTKAEESAGLYESPSSIGVEEPWSRLLQRKGVSYSGHQLRFLATPTLSVL